MNFKGKYVVQGCKKIILSLCTLVLLGAGGCAPIMMPPKLTTENFDFPGKNEITTAEVGDQMIAQGTLVKGPGMRFTRMYEYQAIDVFVPKARIRIPVGSEFLLSLRNPANSDNSHYCGRAVDLQHGNLVRPMCILFGSAGSTPSTNFVGEQHNNASGITPTYYSLEMLEFVNEEAFQRQLTYTGRSGDDVRITYREFQNDFARPAFSQDLVFDLSKGKVVGFKGSRFEILKATNTSITYRILENFRDRQ